MTEVKTENADLKDKLQRMAYEVNQKDCDTSLCSFTPSGLDLPGLTWHGQGVEYMSDGDKEADDTENVEDTDVLAQQRHVSSLSCARVHAARAW